MAINTRVTQITVVPLVTVLDSRVTQLSAEPLITILDSRVTQWSLEVIATTGGRRFFEMTNKKMVFCGMKNSLKMKM